MSGSRTEEPTPRRLREASRRGQVVRSRELSGAAAFAAGLTALACAGPSVASELAAGLQRALLGATSPPGSALGLLAAALTDLARAAAALLLVPAAAAGGAALWVSRPSLSFEPLLPRLDRLDPARGLGRILSGASAAQVGLGVAKVAVLAALLLAWLAREGGSLAQLPRLGAPALWRGAPPMALAAELGAAALAFGLLDLALARRRHRRGLMMTRDEVRREAKEDEGDPQHRAERRRLHRDLLEAGPVATATVVVVNPTHVAVALRHRRERDEAPRVLAKGAGEGAARIRSAARRAGVPIVRDVALARALLTLADVGEEIPAELYEAAAAVLVHVYAGREAKA